MPTGELNLASLHEACPVIKGAKWSAAKWIHVAPCGMGYDVPQGFQEVTRTWVGPGAGTWKTDKDCEDRHKDCDQWAREGQCELTHDFMLGIPGTDKPGHCRKSCGRCLNAASLTKSTGSDQRIDIKGTPLT